MIHTKEFRTILRNLDKNKTSNQCNSIRGIQTLCTRIVSCVDTAVSPVPLKTVITTNTTKACLQPVPNKGSHADLFYTSTTQSMMKDFIQEGVVCT